MKVRNDILKMYIEVHSWVGIISGLALFIAFYAGAITKFEEPLQRWASPPIDLPAPVPLERAPELIEKLIEAHPEALKNYSVNVEIDGNRPARVSWTVRAPGGGRASRKTSYAALDENGELRISKQEPSPVAHFVNVIHQQVGLAFWPTVTRPLMGAIAMLYCIAIVSGVVALLPSLVKDLFTVRLGKNLKRMWLDVHNVLGLFSLPFHVVMAVTSVGFGLFPYFYQAQQIAFDYRIIRDEHAIHGTGSMLTPAELVARVQAESPHFRITEINYAHEEDGGVETHVYGQYPGHAVRAGSESVADVDAYTGAFTGAEFMPDQRGFAGGFASNFVGLHFGNFGGVSVRWAYLLLGMAGAALFYTGNLLWIESRRKKARNSDFPEQSRSTKILSALTVGVPLGCIAGLSLTVAAAKLLGAGATMSQHSAIYYAVFLAFTGYALARGAARGGAELAAAASAATLLVPVASLFAGTRWYDAGADIMVDIVAVVIAAVLLWAMCSARRRSIYGARDSIWAASSKPDKPESFVDRHQRGNVGR